jgi:phosphomannomutase
MGEALAGSYERVVGFEANGGFLTASDLMMHDALLPALPTRDALLPILCLLAVVAERREPVSAVVAGLGLPVSLSDRVADYDTKRGQTLDAALSSDDAFAARFLDGLGSIAGRATVDGAQFFFEDGAMVHFRPSGNAPEMRCYAEAVDAERARRLLSEGLKRIVTFRG